MKREISGIKSLFIILLLALLAGFSSCRSVRELPVETLKPMPAGKLMKQVEENAFDYSNLTIRRINVQFSDKISKTSFRANLRAVKNENILASFSKVNIPVGRILLTPDSVTYVNYIDRNYFVDDYSYFRRLMNFPLHFDIIQSVVSNSVFAGLLYANAGLEKTPVDQHVESFVEQGRYVLQKGGSPNYEPENSGYFVRSKNRQNAGNGSDLPVQKFFFNPRTFNLEKLIVDDRKNNWRLEVEYNDFVKVDRQNYPGSIDMKMQSPDDVIELKIKLNGISTEKIDSGELTIPGSYQEIRMK